MGSSFAITHSNALPCGLYWNLTSNTLNLAKDSGEAISLMPKFLSRLSGAQANSPDSI